MTYETKKALADLAGFLHAFEPGGRTRREFWREFDRRAHELEALASAPDADAEVCEAYYEILDAAHEAYGRPEELADELMGSVDDKLTPPA